MTRMPESAGKDYQLRVVIKDVEILRALAAAGIATTVQLLEKCRSSDKVSRLASTLGIPTETLARFVSACDLMRIRGIGPIQATELAEFTDIQGLLTLREASPQDVVNQLKANERRRPSASTIEGWKNKAAALPLLAETEMGDNWQRTSVLRSARFSFRFIAYLWIMLLGLGFAAYFVTRFRIVAAVQAGILDIEQLVAMKRFLLILYDESLLAFVSMATGIGFLLLLPLPVLQRSLLLFVDGWTRLRERAEYFQLLRFLDARGSAWDNKVMPWAIGVGTIIGVITLLLSLDSLRNSSRRPRRPPNSARTEILSWQSRAISRTSLHAQSGNEGSFDTLRRLNWNGDRVGGWTASLSIRCRTPLLSASSSCCRAS